MPVKRDKQAQKLTSVKNKLPTTKQVGKAKRKPKVQTPQEVACHFGQPNGNPINTNAQFGKEGGNPRNNGAWNKDDNLRYKLQQIAKMSREEIEAGLNDPELNWGEYEKQVGQALLDMRSVAEPEKRLAVLFDLTNQDSGNPRQQVEQTNYELPIPLSPRELITEPQTTAPAVGAGRRKAKPARPAKKKATKKKTATKRKKK